MTARKRVEDLIAGVLDDDHEANGFALGHVERAEHRRMAAAISLALLLRPALAADLHAEGLAIAEGITS